MGILVQREFTVSGDDRAEFERQSRVGLWENMRHNGAQMIAFGTWAFGGSGEVVVTNSVYENFDHWTATRPWGYFATSQGHIEETGHLRPVFAGRNRLISHSRATIIDYDDNDSEPGPHYREPGEPLVDLPKTFGRQSIVAEREWRIGPGKEAEFLRISRSAIWPWLKGEGARVLVSGRDPLAAPGSLITLVAFRDISHWHRLNTPPASVAGDVAARDALVQDAHTRLLMIGTDYGEKLT